VDAPSALARLAGQPGQAAIILDVDGTLAPIVSRPEDASVPQRTRDVLAGLVDRYRLVACLSGRPGADVTRLVGVDGIRYVGEHGLELEPNAERWADRLAAFAQATSWPHEQGKRLSLSFHYREADDETVAREELEAVAQRARDEGLRPRWGRMVLEIRPPVDADKGTAVGKLVTDSDVRAALYAGDDATDVDAFAGLDGLDVAVRVAVLSDEAPEPLVRAADVSVDGPEALVELLETL
jgi:trehalose 6-phosphate phosphatase